MPLPQTMTPPDPSAEPGTTLPNAPPGVPSGPITLLTEALAERYSVDRPLGRGGMATVYLAHDRKHERRVAVKVLHPEFAASIGAERFLREIRLAATLQHPHVLGLYDSGEVGGQLYYVMPYVDGETVRDRLLREQQLPVEDALQITAQVANALAYAHGRGIVHRDVKPENVLLSDGHAVVADFGIARAISAGSTEKLTATGMAIGTPHYMSPEQGTGGQVGPQTDVYALGCVLYEMLVGEPPFTGPNPMAIIAKHAMAEVPSLRIVRSAITGDVEHLVRRALAKNPADRWASAAEFEKAIRLAASGVTATYSAPGVAVAPRASGGVAVATRPPRRGIRTLAVSGGLLAALGGALVVARPDTVDAMRDALLGAVGGRAAPADVDARRIAVLYLDTPAADTALRPMADGLTEALAESLDEVPALDVLSAGATLPWRAAAPRLDSVAATLNVGTLVTGRVEREGDSRVRLTVALRDASGATFADTSIVRAAGDVLQLRDDVVAQAAGLIRRRLGEAIAVSATRAGTRNAGAWALLQRGFVQARDAESAAKGGDDTVAARADAAADSLFAAAGAADRAWSAPVVARSRLAYAQSRRHGVDPSYAAPFVSRAQTLGEQAVALDSSASAFAARGMARYWAYLLRLGSPDGFARDRLLDGAQTDLERATRLEPDRQAEAWSSLSHLYTNVKTLADAKLAALRAYQADAYLTGAESLLNRLYAISADLGQFDDARRYCGELARRFPASPRASECGLWLLSVPDAPRPAPGRAWALAAERTASAPPAQRASVDFDSRIGVAAALAREGLADSGRRVLDATLRTPVPSPGAALSAAWAYTTLGDATRALALLTEYLTVEPTTAAQVQASMAEHWRWRTLQNDPRYLALFGMR